MLSKESELEEEEESDLLLRELFMESQNIKVLLVLNSQDHSEVLLRKELEEN